MQKKSWAKLLLVGTTLILGCSKPELNQETLTLQGDLDTFLTDKAGDGFTGVVLIADGGDVIYRKGFGKNACGQGSKITPDQVFLIGSIVKPFTKAAIYKLQEKGLLNENDTLDQHFANVPDDKKNITIFQILTHQAGFADFATEDYQGVVYNEETGENNLGVDTNFDFVPTTKTQLIDRALKTPLIYEPGTSESYSNMGYALLAALIENTTKVPYETFINQTFFRPAGMANTGYMIPDWSNMDLSVGCFENKPWVLPNINGKWMEDGPSWNLRGNGGMLGTVDDLLKWTKALRENIYIEDDAVFNAFSKTTIGTSGKFNQRATAGFGGNGIYNAVYYHLFDSNITLITMSNSEGFSGEEYLGDLLGFIQTYLAAKSN